MNVTLRAVVPGDNELEIVEHKGIGRPDTMCDGLAEAFGVALGRYYLDRFGAVLHFNVDKAPLVGGESRPAFGAGRIVAPIRVLLAGRATRDVRGVSVPVDEIARESSRAWIRAHLHALDPDRHMTWDCLVRGGSKDLVDLFLSSARPGGRWLANDTSVSAGYAPLSTLERTVLAVAERLQTVARVHPAVGEDVKIMGVRRRDQMSLTIACAFVCGPLASVDDYVEQRDAVVRAAATAAREASGRDVSIDINMADDPRAGRVYITVTGTSAEAGDHGQVGRGNRVNGLITPYHPMSLEAAAGKNPISHIGKLYNVAAHRIAAAVVAHIPEVVEAHCYLLGRIGHPIDDPSAIDLGVRMREGMPLELVRDRILEVARDGIGKIGGLASEMLAGAVRLF